jgi:hypothetical protein
VAAVGDARMGETVAGDPSAWRVVFFLAEPGRTALLSAGADAIDAAVWLAAPQRTQRWSSEAGRSARATDQRVLTIPC